MVFKKISRFFLLSASVIIMALMWNRKAPENHSGIFQGLVFRVLNPVEHRNIILGNFPALIKYLEQENFYVSVKNESDANVFLAFNNIEWGNYSEAVFYARRGVELDPQPLNLRIYALTAFLSGGKLAEAILQGNDPLVQRDFSAFYSYRQLVTSRSDMQTKQAEIRRMLVTTGGMAYDFLLSFLLSQPAIADVAELDMIAGEVALCFNQYDGIEIQEKSGAEFLVQVPERSMKIASDGSLSFGLCALAMADLYFNNGQFQAAEMWNKRAALGYHLAEKSANFSPAFKHRFNALAETGSRARAPLNLAAP
jgi:tetratricopeptide (TPR) repeat protein